MSVPPSRSPASVRHASPTGSAGGVVVAVAVWISTVAGCSGGPAEALRHDGNQGFLGGRTASDANGPAHLDRGPPSVAQRWHPPLLAQFDSWMPGRPGQALPLPAALPGNSGGVVGSATSNAGVPSQYPVLPAVFNADKLQPSNNRDWVPEHQLLAWAKLERDELTVHNVRNCEFYSYRDCLVDHYDRTYRLSDLRTVDFLVVPFNEAEALAHTMLSFGFANGDYLGVSVEVRLEKGEQYHPASGLLKQFEIIYVVADERDLIRVRIEHRDCDVLAYRSKATPAQARALLLDIMNRVNHLHDNPEFYDTLSNNCTTNIVRHINRLAPDRVPYDYRVLLPGFADHLAYELGLIDNSVPFAELKRKSRVNDLALRYKDSEYFSAQIRGETVYQ